MKKQIAHTAIIIVMIMATNFSMAQWHTGGFPTAYFAHLDYPGSPSDVHAVTIGDFDPSGSLPNSFLHINTNLCTLPASGITSLGEMLRTDCPIDNSTYWRQQRGGFEYGTIYSLSNADDFTGTSTGEGFHFYLQASYFERDNRTYGDIRFNTGVVNPATSAGQPRMRIIGENGYVGIGDYTTFLPQNLLQLHIPSSDAGVVPNVYEQFTNGNNYTANSTDGFRIGITYNPSTFVTDGELIQRQNSQIKFFTDIDNLTGAFPFNSPADRMRIGREFRNVPGVGPARGDLYLTRVAITEGGNSIPGSAINWNGANSTPLSLLHLGQAWSFNMGGHRSWMDVGTFTTVGSDVMYYGLKEESHGNNPPLWTDNMDGIIAWGDNIHPMDGADNLRFLFTASQIASNGHAGNSNGVETARISSMTRMGIGNFTTPAFGNGSGIQPQRRLEIYDEHMLQIDATNNLAAAPQLRLTYTPSATLTAGIWTDFQTTDNGDLFIHPFGWTTFPTGTVANDRYVGINISTPGNTMEINSGITTPVATPARQIAGLRFTNLTNNVTPITNPDPEKGVLSVDINGDVIFVTDEGNGNINGCSTGGSSGINVANVNYITKITNLNEICNSAIWENNSADNSVGIGTITPTAKLDVLESAVSVAPFLTGIYSTVNGANTENRGGIFIANTAIKNRALMGTSSGSALLNVGGEFFAALATDNIGIEAQGSFGSNGIAGRFTSTGTSNSSIGVLALANSPIAGTNVGGEFSATSGSVYNYGITASASSTSGLDYAGYFTGDIKVVTTIYTSDSILKTNIQPLSNGLSIIQLLEPKSYDFKINNYPQMNLPNGTHFGLIAQQVQQVLPQLVKSAIEPEVNDSNGNTITPSVNYLGLNYIELIPYLIAAVKEQQLQIDSLRNAINYPIITNPNTPKISNPNTIEVKLSNQNKIILNQNDPNPFAENTNINYFIPDNVNAAQLLFYDNSGTILKTVDIKEKGQGSILIYGSNLSSGVYTYTLLADGKPIETKRMVKIK